LCCFDLFEWGLSGVKGRHLLGAMPHLLTKDGGIQTRQFPPLVTAATEGMQSALGQTECPQSRVQAIMQNISFENWSVAPGTAGTRARQATCFARFCTSTETT
jgi:hypothetical protein